MDNSDLNGLSPEAIEYLKSLDNEGVERFRGMFGKTPMTNENINRAVANKGLSEEALTAIRNSTPEELSTTLSKIPKNAPQSKVSSILSNAKKLPGIAALLGLGAAASSGDILAATPVGASEEIGTDESIENPNSDKFKLMRQIMEKKYGSH